MAQATAQQKRNRKEWLSALEGGRYPQTTGKLFQPEVKRTKNVWAPGKSRGYCCLGVGARVAKVETKTNDGGIFVGFAFPVKDNPCPSGDYETKTIRIDNGEPPAEWFMERYGVTEGQAKKIISKGMYMNDNDKMSFKEIAPVLRDMFKAADAKRRGKK